jgi:hypothetical protein
MRALERDNDILKKKKQKKRKGYEVHHLSNLMD